MDIKQVPAHTTNYTHRNAKKHGIVFHWIVGESADATFRNPGRNASAHFSVLSNGNIHQHVDDNLVAWHAGPVANSKYLGIEHAGGQLLSNGRRKHPTALCHEASAQLCAYLCRKHNLGKLKYGVNAFKHNQFMNTTCSGSLGVAKIIRRTNEILDKPQIKMDYKIYTKNNNLYIDIIQGSFVGEIMVERISGPEKGTYIKNININRPNGGRGDEKYPLVKNMDKIKYKVIFPNNHKIFDNEVKRSDSSNISERLKEKQAELERLEKELEKEQEENQRKLEEEMKKTEERIDKIEKEFKENEDELVSEYKDLLNDAYAELADKQDRIDVLSKQTGMLPRKTQKLVFDIIQETEDETGFIKKRMQRWHNFIDRKVSSNTLRSLAKYDLFVFVGQNIPRVTVGLAALITLIQSTELPIWLISVSVVIINILIDSLGIAFKIIATTFGNKDGEISDDDYKILKDYV